MTGQEHDQRRVVAVVVTFNRLELVRRLVARLGQVAGVDEVVVVDNASTDGTGEWLATQDVVARTLDRNRGERAASTRGCGWRSSAAPTWSG